MNSTELHNFARLVASLTACKSKMTTPSDIATLATVLRSHGKRVKQLLSLERRTSKQDADLSSSIAFMSSQCRRYTKGVAVCWADGEPLRIVFANEHPTSPDRARLL